MPVISKSEIFRPLCVSRSQGGESPLWDAERNTLYWVDMWSRCVRRLRLTDSAEDSHATHEMACAVVLQQDGRLLVMLESGAFSLEFGGDPAFVSAPEGLPPTHRFNDATIDPLGRLVVGSMRKSQLGLEPTGTLYLFDGRSWRELLTGFWTINGLAFSPDGGTLYVSDSHPTVRTVWACDYHAELALVGPRRIFVDMHAFEGLPDGAAVDTEGCYWIAGFGAGHVYRFDAVGRCMQTIEVPVEKPTKVAFGGPDMTTIYLTSMAAKCSRADTLAGAVLEMQAPVPGVPIPPFTPRK